MSDGDEGSAVRVTRAGGQLQEASLKLKASLEVMWSPLPHPFSHIDCRGGRSTETAWEWLSAFCQRWEGIGGGGTWGLGVVERVYEEH